MKKIKSENFYSAFHVLQGKIARVFFFVFYESNMFLLLANH